MVAKRSILLADKTKQRCSSHLLPRGIRAHTAGNTMGFRMRFYRKENKLRRAKNGGQRRRATRLLLSQQFAACSETLADHKQSACNHRARESLWTAEPSAK